MSFPPPAASRQQRMHWMDMLRGIAVLLVVILHGADIPYLNGNGVEEWAGLNRYLEPFRMPLLMFLSGMLLPRSLEKPMRVYLWGKFAAIGWPLLVWIGIFGVFIYRGGIGHPSFWLSGGDYLWFLTALIICYLVGIFLKPLVRSTWWLILGALALFIAFLLIRQFGEVNISILSRTLYNGSYFFLGAAFVRLVPRWLKAPALLVLVLGIIAAVISHLGVEDRSLRTGGFYAVPGSIIGISVAVWLAARVPDCGIRRFLTWMGRSSIVVYIVHFPAIVPAHRLMMFLGADPVTHTIVCTLVGLAVSVGLVALRPHTSWLYLFPGHQKVQGKISASSESPAPKPPI